MTKKLSRADYCFFAEAWCLLALARLILLFAPFRKMLPLIGKSVSEDQAADEGIPNSSAFPEPLKQINYSIIRACRRSPWRTKCFEQALAARMMLRRRKKASVIYFGVRMKSQVHEEPMSAHAWIECDGFIITGGRNRKAFTVVGRFMG